MFSEEVDRLELEQEEMNKAAAIQTHILNADEEPTQTWTWAYYLLQLQSMMKASPQVANQIQEDTVTMVEASTCLKRSAHWRPPVGRSLKNLRTDSAVWVLLLAGIEVAKCRRILSFTVDETECECESLQNIILTIESTGGELRDIVLDGVVVLTDK